MVIGVAGEWWQVHEDCGMVGNGIGGLGFFFNGEPVFVLDCNVNWADLGGLDGGQHWHLSMTLAGDVPRDDLWMINIT